MTPVNIQSARREFDEGGYPRIMLTLGEWPEEVPAYLDFTKSSYMQRGWIWLGSQYDFLPILTVEADPDNGIMEPQRMKGFTDDPAVFYLVNNGIDLIEDQEDFDGPVPDEVMQEAFAARSEEREPGAGRAVRLKHQPEEGKEGEAEEIAPAAFAWLGEEESYATA